MRILAFLFTLSLAASSFAQSALEPSSINMFFQNLSGNWVGQGSVAINGRTYPITVTQTNDYNVGWWIQQTIFQGMPGKPITSLVNYQLADGKLLVNTIQYEDEAQLQIATSTRLRFTTVHTDPVSGRTVTLMRDMALEADGSLVILSDIFQNGMLVEHFDYLLRRGSQDFVIGAN